MLAVLYHLGFGEKEEQQGFNRETWLMCALRVLFFAFAELNRFLALTLYTVRLSAPTTPREQTTLCCDLEPPDLELSLDIYRQTSRSSPNLVVTTIHHRSTESQSQLERCRQSNTNEDSATTSPRKPSLELFLRSDIRLRKWHMDFTRSNSRGPRSQRLDPRTSVLGCIASDPRSITNLSSRTSTGEWWDRSMRIPPTCTSHLSS